VTINPYLGRESVEPYLEYVDKGIVLLCRTSNPGSAWLQNYPKREPVYLRVAREAAVWNTAGNVMLVAGATYPNDLARIRACVGEMPLLVPGIGAQGGDLAQVLQSGSDRSGAGLVINASRSILYASDQKDFASAAALAACTLRDQIRALQAQMPQQRKPES
jgi:orotidine-5'-phosphate decarboxylase